MDYTPTISITDSEDPPISDLNLQIDDVGKTFELECIVKMEQVEQSIVNNSYPKHQYRLVLQSVSKFVEEVD